MRSGQIRTGSDAHYGCSGFRILRYSVRWSAFAKELGKLNLRDSLTCVVMGQQTGRGCYAIVNGS
jgi:hypothetical protein